MTWKPNYDRLFGLSVKENQQGQMDAYLSLTAEFVVNVVEVARDTLGQISNNFHKI